MHTVLLVVQVLIAAALIGLILLQQGKGADVGAAFGSGASGTVFGARGSANFLSRTTAVLAALFFANSLTLAYLVGGRQSDDDSIVDHAAPTTITQPAAPAPAAPTAAPAAPAVVTPAKPAAPALPEAPQ